VAQYRYDKTHAGTVTNLRKVHGLDYETAYYWADLLTHPETTCAICGIPQKMVEVYTRDAAHWILGVAWRLTLDHITPGVNDGNYRPLCHACNSTRGPARFTDEEVLQIVGDKWRATTGLRFLWWLNTSPGVGGRANRSPACAARDARFVEGDDEIETPSAESAAS
jgi:hypothetical protein